MLPKCYDSSSIDKFVYFVCEFKISNLYNYDISSFDNFDSNGEEKHYTNKFNGTFFFGGSKKMHYESTICYIILSQNFRPLSLF
jgi:hypothetical protein